jgi:DNA-binding beta-propeller fold protein YncE
MKPMLLVTATAVVALAIGGAAGVFLTRGVSAQQVVGVQQPVPPTSSEDTGKTLPITLRTRIPLPGVYGRMDHYGFDSKRGIMIVSALGNSTVEILENWKRVHTITGFDHPQGIVYVPDLDKIVVSDQAGKVRFYNAETYALLKALDFGADADTDNLRYDAPSKRIYVGYGEDDGGALAVVDAAAMERLQEYKLGSHPESFQLEKNGTRIFVNLPDQESFGIVDRKTGAVTKWKIPGNTDNHSLTLDEASHRLFTAALQPGRLTVVDTESGRIIANLPCVEGVDDIWFDASRKRLYVPGSGFIDVFRQIDPDHYTAIAHIPVGQGAGSTSYYIGTRTGESLYMSWPNMLPQGGSEVLLFYVND